ncbi:MULTISPECIES: hypothetical protein [unclassified Bradyrhizobium]|uniref:hypothetical protein n=1 Tax=unclassified Bradyrhizobium TaxID=2631580 RepID=UPI002916B3BA|nr:MULTISPECIES: hypothetical protein [unclassified Bradyrhizobium]
MARTNQLKSTEPKESAEQLVEIILTDAIEAAAMPFGPWRALNPNLLVPMVIRGRSGYEYRVTRVGVDAMHRLTDQEWRARDAVRQTIARSEFDKISFQAMGDAILDRRTHIPDDAVDQSAEATEDFFKSMTADYRRKLEDYVDAVRRTTDRHIQCNLFHADQNVPSFKVGPVEFLPRAGWLKRYIRSDAALEHVRSVQDGRTTYEELRTHALAAGSDQDLRTAWQVLSSLNGFGWVATVRMEGHELAQSHHKASILVGLAIDAIGLRFQVEDARRFTKAGRQHLFSEERLATSTDGKFLAGWSVQMPGLGSAPGALAAKMAAERAFLDAAGKVLQAYAVGRQTGRAPHLVERWANALYWVGEARREASDFMAVVNYGCAADGLSGAGGEATNMMRFAEAALNPKGKPIPAGSLSIAGAVNRVYREGRNKLAHGETVGLLEDHAEIRSIGDSLLTNLLDVVTVELAAVIDDPSSKILVVREDHAYRAFEAKLKARA